MFPNSTILRVCDKFAHKYKIEGSNIITSCFSCKKGKRTGNTSIDRDKNCWKCHACGVGGGLKEIAIAYKTNLGEVLSSLGIEKNSEIFLQKKERKTPRLSLDFFAEKSSEVSIDYLEKRCIDTSKLEVLELKKGFEFGQLQQCYKENFRLVVPIFSPDGSFSSCKFRKNNGEKGAQNLAGAELFLIGWEHKSKFSDGIVICEGEIDYYSLKSQDFHNVLAAPSATYTVKPEEIKELPNEVYFIFDSDQAGISGAERNAKEIKKYAPGKKVFICSLPEKDVNEVLTKRQGKFWSEIGTAMASAAPFTGMESAKKNIASRIYEWKKRAIEAKEMGDYRPKSIKIETGNEAIDAILGGLRYGLYGIAGAPGIGKTSVCLQMAMSMLLKNQDLIVLFHSLEMAREEMENTILSWIAGVDYYNIVDEILSLEEIEKIESCQKIMGFLNRLIVNDTDTTISKIENTVSELKGKIGGKKLVVFVDYLQQVQNDKYKEKRDAIGATAYALKSMGLKHKIPVLAISSIGREQYKGLSKKKGENPNPLAFFKESGDIEYGLYAALVLVPSEGVHRLRTNKNGRVVEIAIKAICPKNRFGGCKDREGNFLTSEFALDFTNGSIRNLCSPIKTHFNEDI